MLWLLVVSLVWGFSFGLIKGRLTGIDPSLVALLRLTMSLVVFLPLFRCRGLRRADWIILPAIGAVQFGAMYVVYTAAYHYLQGYEVAVWTIFTPVFVCLIEDALARRVHLWPIGAAVLATVGAGIITPPVRSALIGILLVQLSNICFAVGQVTYRRWRQRDGGTPKDGRVFALLYAGAVLATLPTGLPAIAGIVRLTTDQWLALAYLGIVASGLCFFLWNFGAARTSPGLLAVANNAKVPFGVLCSLLFFHEAADLVRLALGGAVVAGAMVLADRTERARKNPAV